MRAMEQIGALDAFFAKPFGFDKTTIFAGLAGHNVSEFETPRLAGPQYSLKVGIRRTDLQGVLANKAEEIGAEIRLGVTVKVLNDHRAMR